MSTLSIETVVILGLFRKGVRTIKAPKSCSQHTAGIYGFHASWHRSKGGDDTSPVRRSANLYVLIRMPRIVIVIDIRDMGRIVFLPCRYRLRCIGVIRYPIALFAESATVFEYAIRSPEVAFRR